MHTSIARSLSIRPAQVSATLALIDDQNSVPFIARYRKEATGGLDEVQIRAVEAEAKRYRALEARRATILASIRAQDKLSDALAERIGKARDLVTLEDLYAPYKSKRLTRAGKAEAAGLTPLADAIMAGYDPRPIAQKSKGHDYPSVEEAIAGAQDIIAERFAASSDQRHYLRTKMRELGRLAAKKKRGAEPDPNFEAYYDFAVPIARAKPHQILALRRGESLGALSGGIEVDDERAVEALDRRANPGNKNRALIRAAIEDGYKRLLRPAIERDLRRELDEAADRHAVEVFAKNLENLLMRPPLPARRVMGVDPGYRTGCKIAVVDEAGEPLETSVVYLHDQRAERAPAALRRLIVKHEVGAVAVGNGTASDEAQRAVAQAIEGIDEVRYAVVDEAGASVYSASEIAREELPGMDVSLRGAVSIARRLQDPLAELVKIDPRSIGVGMYQHDVDQARLGEAVSAVVVDAVHRVGVDLETASPSLLTHVSGIGPSLAQRIVAQRRDRRLRRRRDLLSVAGLGPRTFEQCAGFIRVRSGPEPLDATAVHPERYEAARALLEAAGTAPGDPGLGAALGALGDAGELARIARAHGLGSYTLDDIIASLTRPGRDVRGALDERALREKPLTLDDLREGMKLSGVVRNVVDFGAFIDLGLKQDGLVHVSKMAERFVRDPHQVVAVGDRVEVSVVSIDRERERIGLSMVEV